jgi:ferredoxin--NADP+ reductase
MDRLGFGAGETAGYACGNPDMIETVKGIFARARLDEDAIHEEKYFTTPATGSTSTVQPEIQPEPATKPKRKSRKPPPGALKLKAVKAPPSS